ncbi:precorrin-3B C(17)-methyltransferase [Granulosicoccus antarcticus]|uniref:Precorrin-3B C(17)-methyltransferase n=1 Tax=Granulosicoccus antarcticus IMCC3135 TaxID=1192854 RepID=A0A2Z2NKQ2_9GAMM|nr:precorrin-3B C(17)-methyltransferase [Granulosicoccus antarcticus]ASJ71886.1 Precorrin-3B C(17)-methyltransferase [Granulosicoccus antarcticus IMCC3135]
MSGWLTVVGLGPGDDAMTTPQVSATLQAATDVVGYSKYVERVPERTDLTRHASDNRVELERAQFALDLAAGGSQVVIVSSGDPGVFAMAAAVFEALEQGPENWLSLDISIQPGISALLAAAASLGAPLGHDFCAINLSDNLKPWALIETRLRLAAQAEFVMALYNPRSAGRPHQFARALDLLRECCGNKTLISFARDVSKPSERLQTMTLAEAKPDMADMRTLVIVGSAYTRRVGRYVYTPRSVA